MSTTGRRTVGWQDPRLLPLLLAPRGTPREAYVETSARLWRLIGSPGYPEDPEAVRERAGETFDRGVSRPACCGRCWRSSPSPTAPARCAGCGPGAGDPRPRDRMVHVSGGRATAQAIPGAELLLVPGMGHDVPVELHRTFVDAIVRAARAARCRAEPTRGSPASH